MGCKVTIRAEVALGKFVGFQAQGKGVTFMVMTEAECAESRKIAKDTRRVQDSV